MNFDRTQFEMEITTLRQWTSAAEERCSEWEALTEVPKASAEEAEKDRTAITVGQRERGLQLLLIALFFTKSHRPLINKFTNSS